MISNVVIVSGEHQRDSVIRRHISILSQTFLPSRLTYNIDKSSMCYTVIHFIYNSVYMTFPESLTVPSLLTTLSLFSVSLFLVFKFICIVSFFDSTYKGCHSIFLLCLTYLTQYDNL